MTSPGPSPLDIQQHLYLSFLAANTADVALRVRGSWAAIYRLHRVVLIQSGFFRSLFTAGFAESSPRLAGHLRGTDEIDLVFDDHNITRAAFEICISRLYGGGPPLHIPPSQIPTTSQPLTPSFPIPQATCPDIPAGHHLATARFLLSLLATSIYLSIPTIASQALSSILSSVGPHTVLRYLNFASGKPIDSPEEMEPVAAVGLEHIAEEVNEEAFHSIQLTKGDAENLPETFRELDIKKEDPSEPQSPSSCDSSFCLAEDHTVDDNQERLFHYGSISDKIGEAAACWLARWGPDIFVYEEGKVNGGKSTFLPFPPVRRRAQTIPSESTPSGGGGVLNNPSNPSDSSKKYSIPVIWARGGLNAKWIRALVSSDALFIRGERERYEFARSVVELRRQGGLDVVEEKEWAIMFEQGIYYANLSMEDIITISRDISPTTNRPFVPLSVLQTAHWSHSVLRHDITVRPSPSSLPIVSPTSSSPTPREKELGITYTTADILKRLSALDTSNTTGTVEKSRPYYPIPVDSSLRIGDSGNSTGTSEGGSISMDQLFASSHSPSPTSTDPVTLSQNINAVSRVDTSESNFFGLLPCKHIASSCIISDATGKSRWSPYPPFRFAVEFWDLDSLKEKSRLHSHTVWYAGSLFNIYVQIVRKKGQVQLGIYLHRQSSVDPIPPPSAPSLLTTRDSRRAGQTDGEHLRLHTRGPSLPSTIPSTPSRPTTPTHYSPSIYPPSRSTTPLSSPPTTSGTTFSTSGANKIPATAPPIMPPQPYRDPRPSIMAYFTINCASATGSSQTRFTSAPDIFSVSQSWGWKSSSLRTEEYIDVGRESPGMQGKEVSFRATVVMGLV